MDVNNLATILGCVLAIIVIGIIFKIKLFKVLKLVFNSILGGILIFIINKVGISFGIHIGLNIVTSMIIGIFGVPGAMLLLAIKIF